MIFATNNLYESFSASVCPTELLGIVITGIAIFDKFEIPKALHFFINARTFRERQLFERGIS